MKAIEIVRRDLREAAYLKHSPVPFAGVVHDFSQPLRDRLAQRQHTGPYYFSPSKPGTGRGFYQSAKGLYCDKAGSTFDLRIELANDHLRQSRLSWTTGYFCDADSDQTLKPIIARLPHGRGFLAGWTMGPGMCAALEADIYADIESAARAAHDIAETDAESERERQEQDDDAHMN
jgi:hypothetical protein